MNNYGLGLERFVCELYKDLGYTKIVHDYRLDKNLHGEKIHGQIDVKYTKFLINYYVECKYRENRNVTFDDYSKFETTLKTFNIPTFLGEMITNRYFDDKVIARAKETKIRLIDRDKLIELNKKRNSGRYIPMIAYSISKKIEQGKILDIFTSLGSRLISIDKQIQILSRK